MSQTLSRHTLSIVAAAFAVVVGCGGTVATVDPPEPAKAPPAATVSSPQPAPPPGAHSNPMLPVASDIDVTIVSATLGDNCDDSVMSPDCAGINCGGGCQASNLQLYFKSRSGKSVSAHIVSVTLLDASDGTKLDTLVASNPREWLQDGTNGQYVPWDGAIVPSSEVRTSYDLTSPAWATFSDSKMLSKKYRLRVTVEVDGAPQTIDSVDLSREPAVAT